jgi:hypothetical protein
LTTIVDAFKEVRTSTNSSAKIDLRGLPVFDGFKKLTKFKQVQTVSLEKVAGTNLVLGHQSGAW